MRIKKSVIYVVLLTIVALILVQLPDPPAQLPVQPAKTPSKKTPNGPVTAQWPVLYQGLTS